MILAEVLQGFTSDKEFNQARKLLTSLLVIDLGGQDVAIKAARNFRTLRSLGVTVRKTIDGIMATRCIESRYTLLHNDRDFEPFVASWAARCYVALQRGRRAQKASTATPLLTAQHHNAINHPLPGRQLLVIGHP